MQKIILDTNALIWAIACKVHIRRELNRLCNFNYELSVLDKTISELENLIKEGSLVQKKSAKLALKLIKSEYIKIIKTKKPISVDSLLVGLSRNAIIITQDKELKKKIEGRKIIIRQKSHLSWS